jgi:single-stranded DNA-binding protein
MLCLLSLLENNSRFFSSATNDCFRRRHNSNIEEIRLHAVVVWRKMRLIVSKIKAKGNKEEIE